MSYGGGGVSLSGVEDKAMLAPNILHRNNGTEKLIFFMLDLRGIFSGQPEKYSPPPLL